MAKITMNELTTTLSESEIKELEAAEKMEITFDEECPEMTGDMLRQFHRFDQVPIKISVDNMHKVKSFGVETVTFLTRLVDKAINDPELVKKCL